MHTTMRKSSINKYRQPKKHRRDHATSSFARILLLGICTLLVSISAVTAKARYDEAISSYTVEGSTPADTLDAMQNLWGEIAKSLGQEPGKAHKLPIGIARNINGATYAIALDSMRFTPQGAYIGAYAQLEIPGTNHQIAFAARSIGIGPGGINTAQAKLALVSEERIPILGQKVTMVLTKDGGNNIEWDCNGFQAINLKGYIEFDESLIVTANTPDELYADGTRALQGIVRANFQVRTGSVHDIVFCIDMPDFKTKSGGAIFRVQNLCADLSDIANPDGINFPDGYFTGFENDEINFWRGFYAKEVSVTLPKELTAENGAPVVIKTEDLILDHMGVSVKASVNNLSSIVKADTWPVTIDYLLVEVRRNRLAGGEMDGLIKIPILDNDTLSYRAEIYERDPGWDYSFSIKTVNDRAYKLPGLSATLNIEKGSYAKLERIDENFTAYAVLNGQLDIGNDVMKARDIRFERLSLSSRAPFLTDGVIDISSRKDNKVGNFPISFTAIKLDINQGNPILNMGISVNFMDEKSFSGFTAVSIHSQMFDENNEFHFKLKKVQVETIRIACNMGAFGFDGEISFYRDDPVYGNGFAGSLDLTLTELLKDIRAEVAFGTVDDFRYWRASLQLPITIPIPPVPTLCIKTISGGLSYKMVREQVKPTFVDEYSSTELSNKYVPDKEAGIGFMAGVGLSFGGSVVSAKVAFEVAFNKSAGLRYVLFEGDAAFLVNTEELMGKLKSVDITKADNPPQSSISVRMRMLFNNEERSFHASMKTYMNLLGIVKGVGPNNLVGEAVIHFDPKDWYIYIGRPSAPFGLSVLGLATVQSYFMMGTKVENMPVPPQKVTSVLSNMKADFMEVENGMSTGRGFGMGARFDFNFGFGRDKGFIYAFIDIGAGADILLRNYGDAQCKGRSGPIGFNGWYAAGQAYAYLHGALGIRVKKKKFDILDVQIAALLQAKGFNPAWFTGAIGAKYRLLGGLIKGKVTLKITMGDECELVLNGDELGIDIIGDMLPAHGEKEVNVFSAPQVSFNTAVEEVFEMKNLLGSLEAYRVRLDELNVVGPQGGKLAGEVIWNQDKNVAVYNTHDVLPGTSNVKMAVKIHIEKRVGAGNWEQLTDNGKPDYETKEAAFETGKAPETIPESNVKYAYPTKNQYNFLVKEYGQGYVQLEKGQAYLFENPNGEWKFEALFSTPNKSETRVPISYDSNGKRVSFSIPQSLKKETVYAMSFLRSSASGRDAIDRNLEAGSRTQNVGDDENVVEIAENKLAGTITSGVDKELYKLNFRTSLYGTFTEKMNGMTGYYELQNIAEGYLYVFGARMNATESFDRFELRGSEKMNPLVTAEAVAEGKWYKEFLLPVMYEKYAQGDASLTVDRDTERYGLVPTKAVMLFNHQPELIQLDNSHTISGFAPRKEDRIYIEYRVTGPAFNDYMQLKNKAVNKYLDTGLGNIPENVRRILKSEGYIDAYSNHYYKVNVRYTPPGMDKPTSVKQYNIKF